MRLIGMSGNKDATKRKKKKRRKKVNNSDIPALPKVLYSL